MIGRSVALLLAVALAPAVWGQDASGRLVFTTVGAGGTTGPADDPHPASFVSASLDHTRVWGWRTLRVGGSVQGDVLGRDGYAEAHLGLGAAMTAGPLVLSAIAGPTLGGGTRGVYGPGPVWPDRDPTTAQLRDWSDVGVGLRASAQAVVVVVPEVGVGIEASHDQNTFLPTSGVRLLLSLGTHRQSLIRF